MADMVKIATRDSYGNALAELGEKLDNLVVTSVPPEAPPEAPPEVPPPPPQPARRTAAVVMERIRALPFLNKFVMLTPFDFFFLRLLSFFLVNP